MMQSKTFRCVTFLALLLAFALPVKAEKPLIALADTTNAAVSYVEGDTWILYFGTLRFSNGSGAGTDNAHTRWMDISDANLEYGGIQMWFSDTTGTEDANGILQYSNTLEASGAISVTYTGLDQVQTTAKSDTLGVNDGVGDDFKRSRYVRIKMDGQTGNPDGSTVNFRIFLQKKPGAPKNGVAGTKSAT